MHSCNRRVLQLASAPWLQFWEDEGAFGGLMVRRIPHLLECEDEEKFDLVADLAAEDLGPWLSGWPAHYLDAFRVTLEQAIAHDPEHLNSYLRQTSLEIIFDGDALAGFWAPVWDAVFDFEPTERPASHYRVLEDAEAESALAALGEPPPQPLWPWVDAHFDEKRWGEQNNDFWVRNWPYISGARDAQGPTA